MHLKKLTFLIFIIGWLGTSYCQQSSIFTEANRLFKTGVDYFDKGLFGFSQKQFEKTIEMIRQANEPQYEQLKMRAELFYAKCAVRLNQPNGELLVLDFSRKYDPDPLAQQALIEMGDYYYNERDYEKAIELLEQVDYFGLSKDQRSEVLFKLGYCQFVKKDIRSAKSNFKKIKEVENQFYYPSNYYYGLTEFFDNNYDLAISAFQRVSNSKKYRKYIPYYITQIYFAKGEYDNVIKYAEPKAEDNSYRKLPEINMLIGQAYFERGEYKKALPFVQRFDERGRNKSKENYYQIGYIFYENEKYKEAIENFEQLSNEDNELGQSALYNMADAYLKINKKDFAHNAFALASRMEHDLILQEEALFQYGKLSYDLGYDRDAINSFEQIPPQSKYYRESQEFMSDLLLNTGEYSQAIEVIEELNNRTPKMRETYQQVTYLRGLQLYKDGKLEEAEELFKKSLDEPVDQNTRALAIFWKGEIAHNERKYNQSITELNKYLSLAKTIPDLPDEASVFIANYTQGYNYLKQKNYNTAFGYFTDAIQEIKQNYNQVQNQLVRNQILGDAVLRAGDCQFKRNEYDGAIAYYDEAIQERFSGFVYALYQKAIIQGLRGNQTGKIISLEEIADEYPNTQFADDALLQLGTTYQEMGKLSMAKDPLLRLVNQYKGKSNLINKALLKLGLISYNRGDTNAALEYYKEIFQYNPEADEANSALAAIEEIYVDDLSEPDKYLDFLESIPGYDVNTAEKESIQYQAAESQYENGNYSKAVSSFTNYLRKYPNGRYSLKAHYYRGESQAVLKNYSEALVDYDFIVGKGLSNFYVKALRKAAIISYIHEKDFDRAFNYYSKMEENAITDDERFEAQIGAMQSAYQINRTEDVYNLAQKVISNSLASPEQEATAYLYLGKIDNDRKNHAKAINYFENVIDLTENELAAEARYQIAFALYMQRDLEGAKQKCLDAYRESSGYPYWVAKSVILLSDILTEQGDTFNAKAVLEGLIENYNEDPELVKIANEKLANLKAMEASTRGFSDDSNDGLMEMDEIENN